MNLKPKHPQAACSEKGAHDGHGGTPVRLLLGCKGYLEVLGTYCTNSTCTYKPIITLNPKP